MRLLLDCGRSLAGVSRSQVPLLTFFQANFRIFHLICSKAAAVALASVVTGSAKPSQAKPIELALCLALLFVLGLLFVWLCRRVVLMF